MLLEKIKKTENQAKPNIIYSEGKIIKYYDGIIISDGLDSVGYFEIVKIYLNENEFIRGIAIDLRHDEVGIIPLEDTTDVKIGLRVVTTGQKYTIPCSEAFFGRIIDILGNPIDGNGDILHTDSKHQPVERKAYGVIERKSVNVPLLTGITAIDALVPIGRGQRELIIGDRQTGKTSLAIDIIINQAKINNKIENGEENGKKVYSIYVAVGQKRSKLVQIVNTLKKFDALRYTIIVAATASEPAQKQFLAPFVGTAIGEYFMENGNDALIIYDDLTKHAKAYRQISLLLRRPPGREAYPGDIFYLHSRLLERSARLSDELGGGSLTALPIIETQAGDVSAYIPTNVISITDGQIYLKSELFNSGQKPAVDVGLSVSRVGGSAQYKATKQVAGSLRITLAQFRELMSFVQFGVEVDKVTQNRIDMGLKYTEVLKQGLHELFSMPEQVVVLWAMKNGYANDIEKSQIQSWVRRLLEYINDHYEDKIINKINTEQSITDEIESYLHQALKNFRF